MFESRNRRIYLYTIAYLQDFTETKIDALKKYKSATIEIENGWYSVTILGGLSKQVTKANTTNGNEATSETMEPTFEFIIKPTFEKPNYTADFTYQFK